MKTNAKRKPNTLDIFLLFAVLSLILGIGCRIVIGRLNGPDYSVTATASFDVGSDGMTAYAEMKPGDRLLMSANGSVFGTVESLKGQQSGTITLQGAVTDSGFLLEGGSFVSPFDSYTLTNGYYTVTVTVQSLAYNG